MSNETETRGAGNTTIASAFATKKERARYAMASETTAEIAGLSDEEVRLFILVANGMIRSSIWRGFYRFRGLNADFFDVYLADRPGDVVSIGVGPQGRYFALDHRDSSVRMGETLADVLSDIAFAPADIA